MQKQIKSELFAFIHALGVLVIMSLAGVVLGAVIGYLVLVSAFSTIAGVLASASVLILVVIQWFVALYSIRLLLKKYTVSDKTKVLNLSAGIFFVLTVVSQVLLRGSEMEFSIGLVMGAVIDTAILYFATKRAFGSTASAMPQQTVPEQPSNMPEGQ